MNSKIINTNNDLKIAFQIRQEVFVEEQGVPLKDEFDKFDTLDGICIHLLVYYNERPVGTGRVRFVDDYGKLERICIREAYRKYGLGKEIIRSLEEVSKQKRVNKVKLHGQKQAEGFYKKLGYKTASDIFIEGGIPHVLMKKELT